MTPRAPRQDRDRDRGRLTIPDVVVVLVVLFFVGALFPLYRSSVADVAAEVSTGVLLLAGFLLPLLLLVVFYSVFRRAVGVSG